MFTHARVRALSYESRWDKTDIVNWGKEQGIDYSKTYSCYFDPPCGVCDNCLLRKDLDI